MRLSALLAIVALPAGATDLSCTFTQLCAPETGCQTSDGVLIGFEATETGLNFNAPDGPVPGTTVPDRAEGVLTTLFPLTQTATALLTISQDGAAIFTEHRLDPAGRLQSLSFFGTCAPET